MISEKFVQHGYRYMPGLCLHIVFQQRFVLPDGADQQCVCIDESVLSGFPDISQIFLRLRQSASFEASDLFVFGCADDVDTTTTATTTTTIAPTTATTTTLGPCGELFNHVIFKYSTLYVQYLKISSDVLTLTYR